MLTELDVLMALYSVGAAWKLRDVFGVGLTVSYVDLMQMRYGVVTDATAVQTLDPIPDSSSTQTITTIEASDRAGATAGLGLWYRPHPRVEIGAATRFVPVFFEPEGRVRVDKEELDADDVSVRFRFQLPATARAGVRYIHDTGRRQWFDLELDFVYENWSAIESFDLKIDGTANGQQLNDLTLPKQWQDTYSVRLGGDVNVLDPYLTLRAGGFFESAAVPRDYSHLDFPSFNRGGVGLGATAGARGVYFTLGYLFIGQERREITELTGKVFQERPLRPCPDLCNGASGVPANAGTFESRYHLLSFGLDIRFRELLAKRRERKAAASSSEPSAEP
jgi:long-subunit fatty acid transport protein